MFIIFIISKILNFYFKSKEENKKLLILKHEWIVACAKKRKLEPYNTYEIKSN